MTAMIRTSAPTHRAFQRDKQWQTPGRRDFVHGKLVPMDQPTKLSRVIVSLLRRK